MRKVRFILLTLALLAAPVVVAEPEEPGASLPCRDLHTMAGVGPVCRRDDGLFEVFSPDLRSQGFIHGTDPVPAESPPAPETAGLGVSPYCVAGDPGTYYVQVIYARASNDVDQYASLLNGIRWQIGQANRLVDDAAIATGGRADLRVKCVNGQVEVKNEVLPTPLASASFSTIVNDLQAKGYGDHRVKYWIHYDDTGACSCGGMGHIYNDDNPWVNNLNNGNAQPMYAVTFGYNSTRIWLHELGHNLGAVQNSAPRSTGGWHCVDGRDTMCYDDGGPRSSNYTTLACTVEIFDCGKNDYFNLNPAPGSYLATKWNLGAKVNRFIHFHVAPRMTALACPPGVERNATFTCNFQAADDSTGVYYTVTWGDGTQTRVPATGTVAPGTSQSASHAYGALGARNVTVVATDNDATPRSSEPLTVVVDVVLDKTPPVVAIVDPRPGMVYDGCGLALPAPVMRPTFVDVGCVVATATDAGSAIASVEVYIENVLVAVDTEAPYVLEWQVHQTFLGANVAVVAKDAAGNAASAWRMVDAFRV